MGGPGVHRLALGKIPMVGGRAWTSKVGSPASQVPERGKDCPLSMERVKGMRPVS